MGRAGRSIACDGPARGRRAAASAVALVEATEEGRGGADTGAGRAGVAAAAYDPVWPMAEDALVEVREPPWRGRTGWQIVPQSQLMPD